MSAIRVLVNGAEGKMGTVVCAAVEAAADLELVARCDLGDDVSAALAASGAQVAIDFTAPAAAVANTRAILEAGARPVVGTTGFTDAAVDELVAVAREKRLGGLIAPNFALGMILLQRFAREAVRHFPSVEIIELHHDRKLDAPSGTAAHTAAQLGLGTARGDAAPAAAAEQVDVPGCRGGDVSGIPVHSVRLPGLLAHQEVLFGGPGQILSLRHDPSDRSAFMPGVLLATRRVMTLGELVVGLEHLLDDQ